MPTTAQRRVIDPILSNIAQGYKHPAHVGTALFPRVPVATSGGQVLEFGKESFQLYNTARAPGTATRRIQFGYLGKPFALENHALEAPVPREHARDAAQVPGIDLATRAIRVVQGATSLGLEKQQADLARDALKYDANHKVTLAGTDQWNNHGESKPGTDIREAKEAIRSTIGVYPNTAIIGAKVFDALQEHPAVLERIKYTQTGVVTKELLAALFGVARIEIGEAIYADDKGNFHDVWGRDVVLAYVPQSISGMEEPSYGYTYTMEGHPFVEEPYWENSSKSWIYGVTEERVGVLSGIVAGFLIKDAVAAS